MNSQTLARKIRLDILELVHRTGRNHVGSALSIVDLLAVLYSDILRYNPSTPNWSERDYLILSKGHAALALYAVLTEVGYYPRQELLKFKTNDSVFSAHVSSDVQGIEISTGSLGQGVGYAVGLALGLKLRGLRNHVYCIIGDGENDEGAVWEAVNYAGLHNLNNFTLILDKNDQKMNSINDKSPNFKEIYQGFGFDVTEIDGHNHGQILDALIVKPNTSGCANISNGHSSNGTRGGGGGGGKNNSCNSSVKKRSGRNDSSNKSASNNRPRCIIANTIKGKGVSFIERTLDNHGRDFTLEEFQLAWKENGGTTTDFIDSKADYA
jgi:transketolase